MENGLIKLFKPNSVINWDDQTKKLILLGNIEQEKAILIVAKKAFEKKESQFQLENAEQFFSNDIYSKYTLLQQEKLECELIYPARQTHIDKYSKSELIIENETYEDFKKQNNEQMPIDWVYNILDKKKEVENILFENEEFMILKDYVFVNSNNIDDLHLLALPFRRDIKSLRDLRAEHIGMLEGMQAKGLEQIKDKYGLEPQNVKIFVHYLPSFYHFHVHFTHSSSQGQPFRDHPLLQIIHNLQLKDDYYQNITLQYVTKKRINSSYCN